MKFRDIVKWVVQKLYICGDSYYLRSVISTLTTNDWSIMKDGPPLFETRGLSAKERKKAEKIAIDILTGNTRGVNLFAIKVLGELKSTQAYPHLKEYSKSAEGHTAAVANALYQIDGSHEWIDVLFKELIHQDNNRRMSAVNVLLRFNAFDVTNDLIKVVNNVTDVDVLARVYDHLLGNVFGLYDNKSFFKSKYRKLILQITGEAEDARLQALNELNCMVKACMKEKYPNQS